MATGPPTRAGTRLRGATAALIAGGLAILAVGMVVGLLVADDGSGSNAESQTPKASASASSTASPSVSDIFQQVGPSVVIVRTAAGSLGTGVIATSTGAVMTANHVVADGSPITIVFADGTRSSATVASADPAIDIALLRPATLPQPIVPATLGGGVAVGSRVVAIGNPLGLTYSVSTGVVSGLDRAADTDSGEFSGLIQFDASVNPGSSGGPLLDGLGNVIGIVIAIADPGGDDAFAGIAFAMPIGTALSGGGGAGDAPGNGPRI